VSFSVEWINVQLGDCKPGRHSTSWYRDENIGISFNHQTTSVSSPDEVFTVIVRLPG